MLTYQINLIRFTRDQENREREHLMHVVAFSSTCFLLMLVSLFYITYSVLKMRETIKEEARKVARIEVEYKKYQTTRMIVDKADIELLDKLQAGRVYWTRKLAAMAFHLPNQYPNPFWITSFNYRNQAFNVQGYGYISPKQEQLITIDDYLNRLRQDSTFCDVFGVCYFNSTVRSDEGVQERVSFDYSALKNGVRRQ